MCVCVWVWLCVCVCSCTFYKMGTTYYYIFIGKVRTLCLLLLNVFAGILSLDDQHANSMEAATVMWNSCSFQFRVPSCVPLATRGVDNMDGERDSTHARTYMLIYTVITVEPPTRCLPAQKEKEMTGPPSIPILYVLIS